MERRSMLILPLAGIVGTQEVAMETKYQLLKHDPNGVVLDANGAGAIEYVCGANQRWVIKLMNTKGNSSTEPVHRVLRRSDGSQLDFTESGNGDTSNTDVEIRSSDGVRAEYTGGTPGARMTFSIEGDLFVKGMRGA